MIAQDLLISGVPLLEKVIRTVVVYIFLIIGLRLAGKRELAQLNSFDLVVLLTLSNTVQNAIIGNDNSLSKNCVQPFTARVWKRFPMWTKPFWKRRARSAYSRGIRPRKGQQSRCGWTVLTAWRRRCPGFSPSWRGWSRPGQPAGQIDPAGGRWPVGGVAVGVCGPALSGSATCLTLREKVATQLEKSGRL